MNEGMIQGGWGFVIAVYTITWGALLAYTVWTALQARRQ